MRPVFVCGTVFGIVLESSRLCPKCERPRFEESLDCPFCGIVYERYRGNGAQKTLPPPPTLPSVSFTAEAPPPEAVPACMPRFPTEEDWLSAKALLAGFSPPLEPLAVDLSSPYVSPLDEEWSQTSGLYDAFGEASLPPESEVEEGAGVLYDPWGGEWGRAAAVVGRSGPSQSVGDRETWLSRNPLLSLVVLGAVFVLTLLLLGAQFDTSYYGEEAEARFHDLTGLSAPAEYDVGAYHRVRDRTVIAFVRYTGQGPVVVMTYHPGGGKEARSAGELITEFEGWLTDSHIPVASAERRRVLLGHKTTESRTLRLGSAGRHEALMMFAPFETRDGDLALLVVGAPPREFFELRRKYVG